MMETNFDYVVLYKTFSRIFKDKLGLIMIELNGNGKQPESPFIAFDIISPRIPNNYLEDDTVFESVVSFTAYAKSKLQALNLSNQMRLLLRSTASTKRFFENNITLVEIMATQPRYVEETNNYAYMYGFDVRLRLKETYIDEDKGTIESIDYKEK
ncbi:hypothetical protein NOU10_04335 [Ligilactobacillus sp. MP3]|nr:hypothetical protein [Ligilactobacillus sp. MP3]MCQ4116617.1 hypothetical protein [Ligilactobacillus sp. MP3]